MKQFLACAVLCIACAVTTLSAAVLKNVTHTPVTGGLDVEITVEGQLKYAITKMDGPARLIIDFQSTTTDKKNESTKVNIGGIQEIRVAQFQKNISRVVVQMDKWYQYFVDKKANSLVIHFSLSDVTPTSVTASTETLSKPSQLKMVDIVKDGTNKVKVFIEFEEAFNYTVKEEKKKMTVELYNAKNITGKEQFVGDGDVVENINLVPIGEKDINLVINLMNEFPANIEKGQNSLVITLDKEVEAQRVEITEVTSEQTDNRVTLRFKTNGWVRFDEKQLPKEEKIQLTFTNAAISDKLLTIPVRKAAVVEVTNSRSGNNVISDIRLNNNISYKIYRDDKDIVMDIDMLGNQTSDTSMREKRSDIIKYISVQKQDISVLLTGLAKQSGYNIIMSQSVKGLVTLELSNVTWETALDIILRTNGFAYEIRDNIIRVATVDEFKREVDAVKKQKEMVDLGPVETRIIPISYSTADDISKLLEQTMSMKPIVDKRTNSLILTGSPERLNEALNMIRYLDKPIPQVMIEAKFVRVATSAATTLGIRWQATNNQAFITTGAPNYGTNIQYGTTGISTDVVTTLLDTYDINMKLTLLAEESKAEVMANPSVTTMSGLTASLQNGKSVPITQLDQAGNTVTTLTDVGIKLDVKATVNASNEVILEIKPEVSDASGSGVNLIIAKNTATTTLLVKDGKTAVIAGLVRLDKSSSSSGVPILKDIPILGLLFKNRQTKREAEEIIIFVTPHIIMPAAN